MMNNLFSHLLLLTEEDIESNFKDKSSSALNNIFSEKGSNLFHMTPIGGFGSIIGSIVKFGDVFMILLLLIGMLYFIYSNIGNSGETRKKGSDAIVGIYSSLMFLHLLVTCLESYSNITGGKLTAFFVMLLGQLVAMSGSIVLYAFATVYLQMYTMTGQESYKRQSKTAYSSMIWVMAGSCVAVVILEFL